MGCRTAGWTGANASINGDTYSARPQSCGLIPVPERRSVALRDETQQSHSPCSHAVERTRDHHERYVVVRQAVQRRCKRATRLRVRRARPRRCAARDMRRRRWRAERTAGCGRATRCGRAARARRRARSPQPRAVRRCCAAAACGRVARWLARKRAVGAAAAAVAPQRRRCRAVRSSRAAARAAAGTAAARSPRPAGCPAADATTAACGCVKLRTQAVDLALQRVGAFALGRRILLGAALRRLATAARHLLARKLLRVVHIAAGLRQHEDEARVVQIRGKGRTRKRKGLYEEEGRVVRGRGKGRARKRKGSCEEEGRVVRGRGKGRARKREGSCEEEERVVRGRGKGRAKKRKGCGGLDFACLRVGV
eukprot:364596-Chlamydomonas_euryale.AAC.5